MKLLLIFLTEQDRKQFLFNAPFDPKYLTAMLNEITMVIKEWQHKSQPLCYV